MRKSRFTDSQIMPVLKQAEAGVKVPNLCREHGMSSGTFYKSRSKFGGMDTSIMKRLKELEDDNARRRCTPRSGLSRICARMPLRESGKAISSP